MKLRILFLISFLATANLLFCQPIQLPWSVIDRGGGRSVSGGFTLTASIGQPAVAAMAHSGISLESGYIPGLRDLSGTVSALDVAFDNGWNMVSVPFIVPDFRKGVLYPSASTRAFTYQGSYVIRDTLKNGIGYWMKFSGTGSNHIEGTALSRDTIPVINNWNMIGCLSYPMPTSGLTPLDTTTIVSKFWGYQSASGYYVEDTLMPGRAYWIKVHNAGRLVLRTASVLMQQSIAGISKVKTSKVVTFSSKPGINLLKVKDASGQERAVYFMAQADTADINTWEMPPAMEGIMDVRFATNRMLEAGEASKPKDVGITISSVKYPITLSWRAGDDIKGATLRIDDKSFSLSATNETKIQNPESKIILTFAPSSAKELPKAFALYQNYPNPFNPSTTIRYDLPEASHVRIVIYDALGREVTTLVDEEQEAGFRSMQWSSTNHHGNPVASGMYFYRIQSGNFMQVKKMIFLK